MRSLSIAATGMLGQQTNVEVISNNIANMNTTGYKRQRAEFQDLLYQEVEADEHVPYVAPFLDWVVYVQSLGSWERHVEKAFAVTVSDLMTKDVHTAEAGETVHEGAKRMADGKVSMLPVVEGGAYAGVITRRHVVEALDRFGTFYGDDTRFECPTGSGRYLSLPEIAEIGEEAVGRGDRAVVGLGLDREARVGREGTEVIAAAPGQLEEEGAVWGEVHRGRAREAHERRL